MFCFFFEDMMIFKLILFVILFSWEGYCIVNGFIIKREVRSVEYDILYLKIVVF